MSVSIVVGCRPLQSSCSPRPWCKFGTCFFGRLGKIRSTGSPDRRVAAGILPAESDERIKYHANASKHDPRL
jgi:hypothetical protein